MADPYAGIKFESTVDVSVILTAEKLQKMQTFVVECILLFHKACQGKISCFAQYVLQDPDCDESVMRALLEVELNKVDHDGTVHGKYSGTNTGGVLTLRYGCKRGIFPKIE